MRTVLITGAASGIGAATAARLVGAWQVVLADKDLDRLDRRAEELRSIGHDVRAVAVDVTDPASVEAMMNVIRSEAGPVDALFSNAGIGLHRSLEKTSEAEWRGMIDVHVKGAFLTARAVLPGMVERRSGAIVLSGSDYSVRGMKFGSAYAAAKSAIYAMAKSIALEFATYGIRCNCVGPGPIDTPLLRAGREGEAWERARTARAAQVPMGRLGTPDEVAAVVEYLLGDEASYLTGQIIHPNGGQMSW